MCPLRCRSAQCLLIAAVLPLAALAGCAADARQLATASVTRAPNAAAPPPLTNPLHAMLLSDGGLSEDEAEAVIARATVAHEMRRP